MNHDERAEQWYKRALEEKDEIIKFQLLYVCLEAIVKSKFNHVRDIKQNNSIKEKFFNKIDNECLDKLKHELDENPIQNMKPEKKSNWSGKLKSMNDFDGIVEFIIRARNNLVHGDKEPHEKRDVFIIKKGTKILQPLVESIIL